jgi:hypothetical protein
MSAPHSPEIYPEDVVAHHRDFIARRRALRPAEEYRTLTAEEWDQFLQHFELRRSRSARAPAILALLVSMSTCVRCPLLRPDPDQMPRLVEIRDNLKARIAEANTTVGSAKSPALHGTLTAAEQKLDAMRQLADRHPATHLGMPDFRTSVGRSTPGRESGALTDTIKTERA